MKKLNDVYLDWLSGDGVFTDLATLEVPWSEENNTIELNMAYHGNHSGDKWVSPIVSKFIDGEVDNPRSLLASTIFAMYHDKWNKLWSALAVEYNPLNNYDMVEHETPAEVTHTITPAETTTTETPAETTTTVTPAETTTTEAPAETTTTIKPAKTVTENEVSAFNSSDYEDGTKSTVTGDANDKGSNTFEVDTAGSTSIDVDTAGSEKIEVDTAGSTSIDVDTAGSDVLTVQNERTLTRSGNIGVTSSQQLLESEIRLRKWLFYQEVFKDLDNVLTLSIY